MNLYNREQCLRRSVIGNSWLGHGLFHLFSKWFGISLFDGFGTFRLVAAAYFASSWGVRRCPHWYPCSVFPCLCPLEPVEGVLLTASSPEAWLMATSKGSRAVRGHLRPSSWMRVSQVIPNQKVPTTSASMMLGSSLHCREKRQIFSRQVSQASIDSFSSPKGCPDGHKSLGSCRRRSNTNQTSRGLDSQGDAPTMFAPSR